MKVSVITVCFNASETIEKTIRSVLNQTYADMEYIVIDGASTDTTVNIIKKVFSEYPNKLTTLISEPDKGIYDAMNKGVRVAKGEYVNLMNSGDWFYNDDVLQNVFSDISINDAGVIYSDFELRSIDESRITKASEKDGELLHQAIIYKKCLHDTYGVYSTFKPIIAADFLFFCLIPSSMFYKSNTVIASYNIYGISNQGNWCGLQILCLKFIFNKIDLFTLINKLLDIYIGDKKNTIHSIIKIILRICKNVICRIISRIIPKIIKKYIKSFQRICIRKKS